MYRDVIGLPADIRENVLEIVARVNTHSEWEENEHLQNAVETFVDHVTTGSGVSCNRVQAGSDAVHRAVDAAENWEFDKVYRWHQRNNAIDNVRDLFLRLIGVVYDGFFPRPG